VVSIEFVFEQQLNFYHGYARQAQTQLSRKVRIWLSRGGKTISAKKKIMMFLQVAALAALLARRIVILQSCSLRRTELSLQKMWSPVRPGLATHQRGEEGIDQAVAA
jgi:hypothetical protein